MINKLFLVLFMFLPLQQPRDIVDPISEASAFVLRTKTAELKSGSNLRLTVNYTSPDSWSNAKIWITLASPAPDLRTIKVEDVKHHIVIGQGWEFLTKIPNIKPLQIYVYKVNELFGMLPMTTKTESREFTVHVVSVDGRVTETKPFTILLSK